MVNWVHDIFINQKAAESNNYNPNWWEAISGVFVDEYWKAT